MTENNTNETPVEKETTVVEERTQVDAGGPLGNVTDAVTGGPTTEVTRTEITSTEAPAQTDSESDDN